METIRAILVLLFPEHDGTVNDRNTLQVKKNSVEQVSIENDGEREGERVRKRKRERDSSMCADDGGRTEGSLKLVNEIDYRRNFLDPR